VFLEQTSWQKLCPIPATGGKDLYGASKNAESGFVTAMRSTPGSAASVLNLGSQPAPSNIIPLSQFQSFPQQMSKNCNQNCLGESPAKKNK